MTSIPAQLNPGGVVNEVAVLVRLVDAAWDGAMVRVFGGAMHLADVIAAVVSLAGVMAAAARGEALKRLTKLTTKAATVVAVAAVIAALCLATTSWAGSAPVRCAQAAAEVFGDDQADIASACAGASDAAAFLAQIGVPRPPLLVIEIVDELPPDLRSDAVGCYSPVTLRIHVLNLRRFLARGQWFGVPADRALYRSIFAHEVAHAIVGCQLGPRRLPIAALECVAYVVMFATMESALRERVLAANADGHFESADSFNDLVYGFDPMRFGVEAYRHWRRQRDGAAWLQQVLAGQGIPELTLQ